LDTTQTSKFPANPTTAKPSGEISGVFAFFTEDIFPNSFLTSSKYQVINTHRLKTICPHIFLKIPVDIFIEIASITRMNIQLCMNGNLEMTLNKKEQKKRRAKYLKTGHTIVAEQEFIRTHLPQYQPIKPEDCGALTDAPLITDGKSVWGYMDYQVKSFINELLDGKTITWQKG
jgi:hypothetical protein